MTTNRLYLTWYGELRRMFTDWHQPQLRNWAWLLVGIYLSRSVHLHRVAEKVPARATLVSVTRRLSRFLEGAGPLVRRTYAPVIRPLLAHLARAGALHLLVDGSTVGFRHQLLMASVAHRRRALPVAWTWVRCHRGHSPERTQLALLTYVRTLLPVGAAVEVAGDCEFGGIPVLAALAGWGWRYALRQKGDRQVQTQPDGAWQAFAALAPQPGDRRWAPAAVLTAKHAYPTNLLALWERGEKEAWLLATNFPDPHAARRCYRRRAWTEQLFGDLKGHGFDLETTHLGAVLKLSRLTLAVVLLYTWLLASGSRLIKRGRRRLVDRADRRDLSLFQIGLRFLERCLANACAVTISFSVVT
jgi:hypothetical protein